MGESTNKQKLFIILLVIIIFYASFSYASSGREAGLKIREIFQQIGRILANIFYATNLESPHSVLTVFFIAIILFLLIYYAVDASEIFTEYKFIKFIISFAVTYLSLISLKQDLLSILIGYGALGATLLILLPLIIIIYFTIKIKSSALAKITWIFFGLYYISLFFYENPNNPAVIFLVFGIFALFMFFFSDYIRRYFANEGLAGFIEDLNDNTQRRIQREQIQNQYN